MKKLLNIKFWTSRAMELILSFPKLVLLVIVFITAFFSYNMSKLVMDPSVEYIMPKDDPTYKLGQKAKAAFIDSKTFLLSAFQPVDGQELFSKKVFAHLEKLAQEIDEYRQFDLNKENLRVQTLLSLSNVALQETAEAKAKEDSANDDVETQLDKAFLQGSGEQAKEDSANDDVEAQLDKAFLQGSGEQAKEDSANDDVEAQLDKAFLQGSSEQAKEDSANDDVEAQLDKAFLQGSSEQAKEDSANDDVEQELQQLLQQANAQQDIWEADAPVPVAKSVQRETRVFDFSKYKPVTLQQIHDALDEVAQRQLQTILLVKKMKKIDWQKNLNQKQFAKILMAWDDLYFFKSIMVVKSFNNPIYGQDVTGKDGDFRVIRFLDKDEDGNLLLPQSQADFAAYKSRIQLNPLNKATLYSQDKAGNINALAQTITLRYLDNYDSFLSYFWSILEKYDTSPVQMYSIGNLVIQEFIGRYMSSDLISFVPLVVLVVLLTFFFNFRSLRGVVLPIASVLVGMVWTMGTMSLLGMRISMLVSILPALLVAIGSSYSIHVFNQYMKDLKNINLAKNSVEKKRQLKKSVLHIFPTVFLAALTTMISFATLSTNQVVSLREFGIFAAVGSFYASVVAFVMIPALLLIMKNLDHKKFFLESESPKEHFIQKLVNIMGNFSISHSKWVVLFSAILVLLGIIGIFQVKVETSPMANFRENSYIHRADTFLGTNFDGTFVLNVIIDSGKENGVTKPEFLNFVEQFTHWAAQEEQKENYLILHVNSFADFVKRIHMAFNKDQPEFFSIPQQQETINDYVELFSGDDLDANGRADQLEQFVDQDFRRLNIIIRTGTYKNKMMNTASNRLIEEKVNQFLASLDNPQGYHWFFVGEASNLAILGKYITNGQIQNILVSLFLIFLLLLYIFRNFYTALVGIIPVTVGISFVYGAMGFLNIPLDIPKVILASVAIGIGVDNTIHFMKTLTHYLHPQVSLEQSLRLAHKEAGLAVVYTSFALIFGFSVLMLSNFVPVFYLGLLVAAVMFSTTFGALIVLPAVIHFANLRVKTAIDLGDFDEH